jgi:hypothetical protein
MNGIYGDNPCKECVPPKRRPGCHAECEEHRAWKEEVNERKAQIADERAKGKMLDSVLKGKTRLVNRRRK